MFFTKLGLFGGCVKRFLDTKSRATSSCLHANGNIRMGFVGTGKIAQAIILGLINNQKLKPEQIYVSDANQQYVTMLKEKHPFFKKHKINFAADNCDLIKNTNTVMLCVKPSDMANLTQNIAPFVTDKHLIMSIAAGVKLRNIERHLPDKSRVIRIMTNMTALIHQSCSVFSRGKHATSEDAECVMSLLEAIGTCEKEISESLMNAVTGLSGSGPAYMFIVLDALADGGVKMGMSRSLAMRLAAQSMFGAGAMVVNELNTSEIEGNTSGGKHVMTMKEEICSPGGSTIYGVDELENHRLRHAFIRCVEAATRRARELEDQEKD